MSEEKTLILATWKLVEKVQAANVHVVDGNRDCLMARLGLFPGAHRQIHCTGKPSGERDLVLTRRTKYKTTE